MALTRPRGFEGQVRGVSHHGQETHLHKQAGYIDADFLHPPTFPLQSDGGPYIAVKTAGGPIVTEIETFQEIRELRPAISRIRRPAWRRRNQPILLGVWVCWR